MFGHNENTRFSLLSWGGSCLGRGTPTTPYLFFYVQFEILVTDCTTFVVVAKEIEDEESKGRHGLINHIYHPVFFDFTGRTGSTLLYFRFHPLP